MHAPDWVSDELYRIHKNCRLGWVGQDREGPDDELNKGTFGLIQLYHRRDAEKTYFGDFWNDRGPIFGRSFDSLFWVPIYIVDVPPVQVFDGTVIELLKRWMIPFKQRYMEAALEKGQQYKTMVDDLAGEQGSYMFWKSRQTDAASDRTTTYAETTEEDKKVLAGEKLTDLTQTFTELPAEAQPME